MKIKVSVAIEKELVQRLDRIAGISNESRSQIIEKMIREAIESSEQLAALMANPKAREMLLRQALDPEMLQTFAKAMNEKIDPQTKQNMAEAMERAGLGAQAAKGKKKGK